LIWDGWGIGSSTLNIQKEDDFTKKALKGQTIEFSYGRKCWSYNYWDWN